MSEYSKLPLPLEAGKFKAFFCMSTTNYINISSRLAREDISSLSNGLMTRDKLFWGPKLAEIRGNTFASIDDPLDPDIMTLLSTSWTLLTREWVNGYTKRMGSSSIVSYMSVQPSFQPLCLL